MITKLIESFYRLPLIRKTPWAKEHFDVVARMATDWRSKNGSRKDEVILLSHFSSIETFPLSQVRTVVSSFRKFAKKNKAGRVDYNLDSEWNKIIASAAASPFTITHHNLVDFNPTIDSKSFATISASLAIDSPSTFSVELNFIPRELTRYEFFLLANGAFRSEIYFSYSSWFALLKGRRPTEYYRPGNIIKAELLREFLGEMRKEIATFLRANFAGIYLSFRSDPLVLERYVYRDNINESITTRCRLSRRWGLEPEYVDNSQALLYNREKNHEIFRNPPDEIWPTLLNVDTTGPIDDYSAPIQLLSPPRAGEMQSLIFTQIHKLKTAKLLYGDIIRLYNDLLFQGFAPRTKPPKLRNLEDLQYRFNRILSLFSSVYSQPLGLESKLPPFRKTVLVVDGNWHHTYLKRTIEASLEHYRKQTRATQRKVAQLLENYTQQRHAASNYKLQTTILGVTFFAAFITALSWDPLQCILFQLFKYLRDFA